MGEIPRGAHESVTIAREGREIRGIHMPPLRQSGEIPVIFSIGWGTTTETHLPGITALAERGKDVWSIDPIRSGTREVKKGEQFPEIEINKAQGVVDLLHHLQEKGVTEVDLVAHSEGAIYTTIAALKAIEDQSLPKISSLVLIEPAGCIGEDSQGALAWRFLRHGLKNRLFDRQTHRFTRENGKTIRRETFSEAMPEEIAALASMQLDDSLQKLHDKGVSIGIIAGEKDGVFPFRRLQRQMATRPFIDRFVALPILHNGAYTEAEKVMQAVVRMQQSFAEDK